MILLFGLANVFVPTEFILFPIKVSSMSEISWVIIAIVWREEISIDYAYRQDLILPSSIIALTWFFFCLKKQCNDGILENWYVTRKESMASSHVDTNLKMFSTSPLIWSSIIWISRRNLEEKSDFLPERKDWLLHFFSNNLISQLWSWQ